MPHTERTISIHPLAPVKVPQGAACNGCGVCCVFEPCPVGIVLTGKRTGACAVLHWDEALGQYRCGAIVATREDLARHLHNRMRWLAPLLGPVMRRLGPRWIAAGDGCDSSLQVMPGPESDSEPGARPGGSTTIVTFSTMPASESDPPNHD